MAKKKIEHIVESKDAINWPEQRLSDYADVVWLQGQAEGYGKSAAAIRELAVVEFRRDCDKEAGQLKRLAEHIGELQRLADKEWKKKEHEYREKWNDAA